MQRRYDRIYSPALEREIEVLSYGHFGAPVIAFPSGGGRFFDFEDNGMIAAVAHLIDAGKIKLYCPDGIDHESWLNRAAPPQWRGIMHNRYHDFIVNNLVSAIRFDCADPHIRIGVTGCSLGAYHAANFALREPHIFHYALCMSGRYDMEQICGNDGSLELYLNNPVAFVPNLNNGPLEFVRHHAHVALVCGQGAWEDKCLPETHRLADALQNMGISHERDIWGHDVEHHWYWWRKQIAHHLGKTFG